MKVGEVLLIVGLGAIWGMSYVFIRIASPVIGPIPLMASRFAIGGSLIAVYATVRGSSGPLWEGLRTRWRTFLILGLLMMALPTTLIGFAELRISAGLASVINASVPFFTALGAVALLGERFSGRQIGGLALGFSGVAVAVGGGTLGLGWGVAPFAAASVLASASYGAGAVSLRKAKLTSSGVVASASAQLVAAAYLLPLVPFTVRRWAFPPEVLYSVLGLALLSTALAYIIFFHLIETAGPTQATTVTFVSPVFGILGGSLLLGEPLGLGLIVGLLLIVLGILLSSRDSPLSPPKATPTAPPPEAPRHSPQGAR